MSISSENFFCKKCSSGSYTVDNVIGCDTKIRFENYTCDEYDPNKKNEIIQEINKEWKFIEGDKIGPTNFLNSRTLNIRDSKIIMRGEDKNDVEMDIELRKVFDSTNNTATWEFKLQDSSEWFNLFTEYFYDKTNESINRKGKRIMKENMDRIPQMIDDKLREFNFYTVDPKKGKQKVSFTDEDREVMKTNFIDMSEKYPEDIAFIRAVVSCRDIDDKTNEPFVRLGSYRDSSNINLPFSKRVNGLEKVLDGGINYFTIMNNPGPDNRDFKIVPGDRIKDVDFDEETKEMMSQPEPQPQQPMKKEEPFEEVMKNKERKGLDSLMEKGELSNDLTKSQKKIIEKLKREGYLFKQPVDEGGYKKMRVKSKEFTEAFEVWKKS
jgi:hypothetical protein